MHYDMQIYCSSWQEFGTTRYIDAEASDKELKQTAVSLFRKQKDQP